VHVLLISSPHEKCSSKIRRFNAVCARVRSPSQILSLDQDEANARIGVLFPTRSNTVSPPVLTTVHRIATCINGRDYYIEVTCVDAEKWRAEVVTQYGGRTALMPFYGSSAADAAQRVSDWLTRASRPGPSSA
jgi:hypothetical protein